MSDVHRKLGDIHVGLVKESKEVIKTGPPAPFQASQVFALISHRLLSRFTCIPARSAHHSRSSPPGPINPGLTHG